MFFVQWRSLPCTDGMAIELNINVEVLPSMGHALFNPLVTT